MLKSRIPVDSPTAASPDENIAAGERVHREEPSAPVDWQIVWVSRRARRRCVVGGEPAPRSVRLPAVVTCVCLRLRLFLHQVSSRRLAASTVSIVKRALLSMSSTTRSMQTHAT